MLKTRALDGRALGVKECGTITEDGDTEAA
jgi:hypothetical protein